MRGAGFSQAHHVHYESLAASFFVQGGGFVCLDASIVFRRDLIVALLSLRIRCQGTWGTPARHGFVEFVVLLLADNLAAFFRVHQQFLFRLHHFGKLLGYGHYLVPLRRLGGIFRLAVREVAAVRSAKIFCQLDIAGEHFLVFRTHVDGERRTTLFGVGVFALAQFVAIGLLVSRKFPATGCATLGFGQIVVVQHGGGFRRSGFSRTGLTGYVAE